MKQIKMVYLYFLKAFLDIGKHCKIGLEGVNRPNGQPRSNGTFCQLQQLHQQLRTIEARILCQQLMAQKLPQKRIIVVLQPVDKFLLFFIEYFNQSTIMRSLLPWISYARKDQPFWHEKPEQTHSKPTLPPSELKPFQLKQLNKHVSEYERYEEPEQIARDTHSSACNLYRKGSSNKRALRKVKIDTKEEIMQKAKQVNNKYYSSLMSVAEKNQLVNSMSLQRFDNSQKENVYISFRNKQGKEKKPSHLYSHLKSSSNLTLKDDMRPFKQSRPFRSKWFTDLQQLQPPE